MKKTDAMQTILDHPLSADQACLWFLGQAGFIIRGGRTSVVIDPYLSDSVGKTAPKFSRAVPVPLDPLQMKVDVFIVTHDHLDHLDPETIKAYPHAATTQFIAPRLACRHLRELGVPDRNIHRLDSGESLELADVKVTGIYAVPTDPSALDTVGYLLQFANGRSVYHSSDTAYSELLLAAAPQAEVLLTVINGNWGNLTPQQAVTLARHVRPRAAIPMHYDVMALNSQNPHTFEYFAKEAMPNFNVPILKCLEPFCWAAE